VQQHLCSVYHFNSQSFAYGAGCFGNGLKVNRTIIRIEQAIKLRSTSTDTLCHSLLTELIRLHCFRQLPGDHSLDCRSINLLTNSLLIKEAVKA